MIWPSSTTTTSTELNSGKETHFPIDVAMPQCPSMCTLMYRPQGEFLMAGFR